MPDTEEDFRDSLPPEALAAWDEPMKPEVISPWQRRGARVFARFCLMLGPLLRRWFPKNWEQIASFNLHTLAYIGEEHLSFRYLEWGGDPNGHSTFPDFGLGMKPLQSAAVSGSVRVAEILLQAGADVNGKDNYGGTALMLAALHGHTDLVAFLLNNEARINDVETAMGCTALFEAVIGGHVAVVKLLVARGADTTYRLRHRLSAADWGRKLGGRSQKECADYLACLAEAS